MRRSLTAALLPLLLLSGAASAQTALRGAPWISPPVEDPQSLNLEAGTPVTPVKASIGLRLELPEDWAPDLVPGGAIRVIHRECRLPGAAPQQGPSVEQLRPLIAGTFEATERAVSIR
jgi:outer membrane protein